MDQKTKIQAEPARQELMITREFDLPVELLFRAYAEPELVAQWMGTMVVRLESKKYGGYQFATTDAQGNVVFKASGVIHEFISNQKIVRTFEMEGAPFGVQLELLKFAPLTKDTTRLSMHVIYESVAQRDQLLRLPFAQGLNMAHGRLQEVVGKLK